MRYDELINRNRGIFLFRFLLCILFFLNLALASEQYSVGSQDVEVQHLNYQAFDQAQSQNVNSLQTSKAEKSLSQFSSDERILQKSQKEN
jgi:hypothetical protein